MPIKYFYAYSKKIEPSLVSVSNQWKCTVASVLQLTPSNAHCSLPMNVVVLAVLPLATP